MSDTVYYIDKAGQKQVLKNGKKEKKTRPVTPLYLLNAGFYLLTPLLIAVIIGVFGDRYYNAGSGFILICIIFGTISSFYNLYKVTKEHGSSRAAHQHQS